jgi:hypothetical protein
MGIKMKKRAVWLLTVDDALTGSVLAAKTLSPIVLANRSQIKNPPDIGT